MKKGIAKAQSREPQVNTDDLLCSWYLADKPGPDQPRTIPLPKTWNRYSAWARRQGMTPDPKQFVGWMWNLYRHGKGEFNHHENPWQIPEEERAYCFDFRPGFTIYYWRPELG